MGDHIKKGSSYMSTRKLCCPRRWPFGKDVASLHHGRYDPLSHYGDLALKNVLPVYILHFWKYMVVNITGVRYQVEDPDTGDRLFKDAGMEGGDTSPMNE